MACGTVPIVADSVAPGSEELVFLKVRANAEGFEIPSILAIVLHRQSGPKFGSFG